MAKRHPPANVANVHSRHDTRAVKYALISVMDADTSYETLTTKHWLEQIIHHSFDQYCPFLRETRNAGYKHNNDRTKRSNMAFKLFYPNSDESVIGTNVSSRRTMSISSRLRHLTITLKFLDIVS